MSTWEHVRTVLLVSGGVILLLLLATLWLRRIISKYKVQKMPMGEKLAHVNALADPFGFFYVRDWDVFSTRLDAWQRQMGYEALFDAAAPAAHMVMDVWPVYFDYEGRTWLIEFWKGQYGINSGGEVGVYHADRIVAPHEYKYAHFDAAEDGELPLIRCRLAREDETLCSYEMRHWWLTGFAMGRFSKPEQLVLTAEFRFEELELARAFCEGLGKSPAADRYEHCGRKVIVTMDGGSRVSSLAVLQRAWAQLWNRFWVGVFLCVTRPFESSLDRLLFLYEQLPGCVRKLFVFDRRRYKRAGRQTEEIK